MASAPDEKPDVDAKVDDSDSTSHVDPPTTNAGTSDEGDDDNDEKRELQQAGTPSSSDGLNRPQPFMDMDRAELTRVASEVRGPGSDIDQSLYDDSDPALDPARPEFDVYKWAKFVLRAAENAKVKFRRASFTFENLTVTGSGFAVHLQATVASVLLAPIRLPEWIRMAKKPQRTILNGFDGVVKPGEMLLVLGRPGSGCSTLLKCIAGELQGFKVAPGSVIHYSGLY